MASRGEELRRRILEVQAQAPASRRYDAALKRDVVAYCVERERAGATIDVVAGELALPLSTISKWVRHARRRLAAGKVPFERLARPRIEWSREPAAEHRPPGEQEPALPPARPVRVELQEDGVLRLSIALDAVDVDAPTRERLGAWLLLRGAEAEEG